jgi:RNA polymerase sigma factor (TIGR02999 family)
MSQDVTQLLVKWGKGDETALEQLLPLVYDELRRRAKAILRRERDAQSLDGTALVHEVYMRLVDKRETEWENRAQFFGLASRLIRNILVDHARSRKSLKRGGDAVKLRVSQALASATPHEDVDIVRLDDALEALEKFAPQQSRIIELRYFTGLSIEETAELMGMSPATVKRHWTMARLWLAREMSPSIGHSGSMA